MTARPEQSAGGAGRTDRHRQPVRTARSTAPATPADEQAAAPDALLTIEEVIAQLRVSRAAFYRWRRRGTGPAEVRLPGGGVRIRRSALQQWLRRLETPAGGHPRMNSYDVRFWEPRKIGDTARGRWRVRWAVAGREHHRSFPARPLADGFLTDLKKAAGDRQPFDTAHRAARHRPAAGNRRHRHLV